MDFQITIGTGSYKLGVASVFAALAACWPALADPAVVRIDSGPVRGVAAGNVVSFKGLPYAAPPVGALRWRMPQPVKPWQSELSAGDFGPGCMQSDFSPKSEDCLTLNVWRPVASAGPLPVMVWIHGGALICGTTSLYPVGTLAEQGIVVVSVNYRLGRFGFFAHPALAAEAPGDVRGNYGHMDQRAALQWVQRNIAAFGGDPANVTIFGESAGGGSVMVHLTSPLSRGLFHRAIMQSPALPTARAKVLPLTELADAERAAVDYAHAVGIEGEGPAALEALRALPADKLLDGASCADEISALSAGKHAAGFASAIRDGKLIPEAPETVFAAGRQNRVPVIVGAADRDLAVGGAASKDELFSVFGPSAAAARKLYDPRGDETLAELVQQVLADRVFVEPARHLADELAGAGQPVWLYRFAYVPQSLRGIDKGAFHGSDVGFTLDTPSYLVGENAMPADEAMGHLASAYWVQFALTGDPNGAGRPVWPRHDPMAGGIFHFTNSGADFGTDPLQGRLDIWQQVSGAAAR